MTARATAYRWQVVAMLWLVCFFNYADRQAIYAVFQGLLLGIAILCSRKPSTA